MMVAMIPPQVGMRLLMQEREKRGQKKKRRPQKTTKNERKREKGQCYYPFITLVLQSSTMLFMIESLLCCHFHILVGIFHYRTWLVYSNDGLPQMPQVFVSKQVGCTPLSFFLSFHTLIALVHPQHGNPYSLTLISIDGKLHSSLIRLVDVRQSSPFVFSTTTIIFHLWCYIHGSRSCVV